MDNMHWGLACRPLTAIGSRFDTAEWSREWYRLSKKSIDSRNVLRELISAVRVFLLSFRTNLGDSDVRRHVGKSAPAGDHVPFIADQ